MVRTAITNDGLAICLTPLNDDPDLRALAVYQDRRALLALPASTHPRYRRAGPAETRLLFQYMAEPFALPDDLVATHILPLCHTR